jgi:hypothetical protein
MIKYRDIKKETGNEVTKDYFVIGGACDFFTCKTIPPGAFLKTPPQLGSAKLHIIGRTEGLCKCEKHNHIILKLEDNVICGWCETEKQYMWGADSTERGKSTGSVTIISLNE